MKKVLVSSCLLGCKVRYNAGALNLPAPALEWLETHVELVAFCPEVAAGLRPHAHPRKFARPVARTCSPAATG